jgi:hypothetical protein
MKPGHAANSQTSELLGRILSSLVSRDGPDMGRITPIHERMARSRHHTPRLNRQHKQCFKGKLPQCLTTFQSECVNSPIAALRVEFLARTTELHR